MHRIISVLMENKTNELKIANNNISLQVRSVSVSSSRSPNTVGLGLFQGVVGVLVSGMKAYNHPLS